MATTTTNFGWDIPQSTDLVKDGATAIAALGQDIDTALVDLKGGTTGQVLAKASATDLDYSWVTTDDTNAIQNAIVDAKGDLIAASAADTPARLAVGNNGEMLVADSSTTTGLRWQGDFAAGKNKIINGDFGIWQRGTSFSVTGTYNADRWIAGWDSSPTVAITRQTFTPGTAPVAGYEGQFFQRTAVTALSSMTLLDQKHYIEDVRTFAGQTVTVSFWAKADAARNIGIFLLQNFGSGGSGDVVTSTTTIAATTSWTRYTATFNVASVSGKTIGTSSYLALFLRYPGSTFTIDIWGVQVEAGSVATAFQTATGTKQGELAACQRYYVRLTADATATQAILSDLGVAVATTAVNIPITLPVQMRIAPTAIDFPTLSTNIVLTDRSNNYTATSLGLTSAQNTPLRASVYAQVASGLTQYRSYLLASNSVSTGYLGFSAEL
jgi:hypothetical protein